MALEKQGRLVKALLKRTRAGEVDWKPTVNENGFQVSFKDNSVLIERVERPREEVVDYRISLINSEGAVVEQFTDVELNEDLGSETSSGSSWFKSMNDLYELARRTALGSDKILNEILGEIDDEIPF